MKKERIYVAGPYCPVNCSLHDAPRVANHNVDRAIEIANQLIEKGHYVFVPHLQHYVNIHKSCKKDHDKWWLENDFTIIERWATALFFIGHSNGADLEVIKADELKLKIFVSIDEVPDVKEQ